jgi:multidrug efflux pump subunit AcrA (membrane-fusion protein)
MSTKRISLTQVALAALLALSVPVSVLAHGEQIEAGRGPKGPVTLTPTQVQALGLKVQPAETRPIADLLRVNAVIALLQNAQADVSVRISGRVVTVNANLGDRVRKDQELVFIESRAVGEPPPTVAITAPMDGVIDRRDVILGQTIEPDSVLFHISDRTRMRAIGKVYEEDLGKVHGEQDARIYLLAYPKSAVKGKVTLVSPSLDPETRTVDVWIDLDNPGDLFKPNMFAEVDIVLSENLAALTVPNNAILEAAGEHFVFVRAGDKFDRVDITIGMSDDQYGEVTSGLVPGDEVVTQGARAIYTVWLTGGQTSSAGVPLRHLAESKNTKSLPNIPSAYRLRTLRSDAANQPGERLPIGQRSASTAR